MSLSKNKRFGVQIPSLLTIKLSKKKKKKIVIGAASIT